jgi:hypothetical protein
VTIYPSEAAAIALAIRTNRPLPAGLARKVVDFAAQLGLELGERRAAQESIVASAKQAQASFQKLTQAVNRLRDENALLRRQRNDAIEQLEEYRYRAQQHRLLLRRWAINQHDLEQSQQSQGETAATVRKPREKQ